MKCTCNGIKVNDGYGPETFDDPIKCKMLKICWFNSINIGFGDPTFEFFRWNKRQYLNLDHIMNNYPVFRTMQ